MYVEPFAGSLACLLHRETPSPREIVCDLDGGICNFWRAITVNPGAVAYWADYPTIHQDLTARHRWLVRWVQDNRERLESHPNYHDVQAAGWWVWGISLWIGGGWCQPKTSQGQIPFISCMGNGQGVSAQRIHDKRPRVDNGGVGVSAQQLVSRPADKRPMFTGGGGAGVASHQQIRPDLVEWFRRIADRLKGVVVLNRSWESALTPSLLQQTATGPKPPVGILLDPPYLQDNRDADIYGSDAIGTSNAAAAESWAWAQEHGDRFRIAYCCHEGDVAVPPGWTAETQSFSGIRDAARRDRRDMVLFSPACIPPAQQGLF